MSFLSQVASTVPASHSVTYSCTMNNNWSAENHPIDYPQSAHWSPPIIAAHSRKYNMWKSGELATKGVENIAEVSIGERMPRIVLILAQDPGYIRFDSPVLTLYYTIIRVPILGYIFKFF